MKKVKCIINKVKIRNVKKWAEENEVSPSYFYKRCSIAKKRNENSFFIKGNLVVMVAEKKKLLKKMG